MLRLSPRCPTHLILSLSACTSSASGDAATDADGSSSSGHVASDSTIEPTTSEGDASTTSAGSNSASDSSASASTTDASTTGEPSPWDGEPLPPEPPGLWTWVDFPDSRCRDGSTTGLGVRRGKGDGLVLFFEGGGACFNLGTCLLNDLFANFGPIKFDAWAAGIGQGGIFNADEPANPVADWNVVYIPYCTGDVHAGDREDVGIPGVLGPQQFVGSRNVAAYLERLVPTFANTSHVLVTGHSAGGFGAAFNYHRIRGAFQGSQVTLLDDSGPPLSDMYLAPCLQSLWRELWHMDSSLPPDCTECFHPDGGGIYQLALYLADAHPDQKLALISSEQDGVIRTFFGYGLSNCAGGIYPPETYQDGLYVLRDQILGDDPVWGSYLMPGTGHTIIAGPGFFTTQVAGVALTQWLADLLSGTTSHINP